MNQSQTCCNLSRCAYGDNFPSDFRLILCSNFFMDTVYVLKRDRTLYVVYRGSDSPMDWLSNFFAVKKRIGKIRIHRGAHNAFKRIRPTLSIIFEEQDFDKVVFTAHSRGGWLAQLSCWFYDSKYEVECITFASPRLGNKAFVESCKFKSTRYVIESDLVPTVPKINYQHYGTEIRLPKQKGIGRSHSINTYCMLLGV